MYAAHVNHNLRGDAAVRDEEFSKELCDRLGIRCFTTSADVAKIAEESNISEELAGRRVRYGFFEGLMNEYDIEYTATAHHKNDNAETIVMNFVRGSGITGLTGIPYSRERYIRPMLDVKRCEIEEYCRENSLEYVTDETNLDTVYTRNKIRNIIIPQLEAELNPGFVDTIAMNARVLAEDARFLAKVTDEAYTKASYGNRLMISKLRRYDPAICKRVIRKLIGGVCGIRDVSSAATEAAYNLAMNGTTGQSCSIIRDVTARIEYGKLVIEHQAKPCSDFEYTIEIGKSQYIPELGYSVSVSRDGAGERFRVPPGTTSITVTNRRTGDRFVPAGMTGSKSVKSFMIDRKIPRSERSRVGIVRVGGEIAWIIGYRLDARFRSNYDNDSNDILISTDFKRKCIDEESF